MSDKYSFSVGVPTHNEERIIKKCLLSILNQREVPKFEIIVVASGCTDSTVDEVRRLMKVHKNIRLIIEDKRRGKISALNKFFANSTGHYLIHTDADVILPRYTFRDMLAAFNENKSVVAVSGRPLFIPNDSKYYYLWHRNIEKIMNENKKRQYAQGTFFHLDGRTICHKRGLIDKMSTDIKGSTDGQMGNLLMKHGQIVYSENIKARTKPPSNYKDFINQKSRTRYGFLKLNKLTPSDRNLGKEFSFSNIQKLFSNTTFDTKLAFLWIGLLYLCSWLKAYYFIRADLSVEQIWKPILSTK